VPTKGAYALESTRGRASETLSRASVGFNFRHFLLRNMWKLQDGDIGNASAQTPCASLGIAIFSWVQ
jgi:hypothetical protein